MSNNLSVIEEREYCSSMHKRIFNSYHLKWTPLTQTKCSWMYCRSCHRNEVFVAWLPQCFSYHILQVIALLLGGMSILSGHVSPEQLTKYVLYCEWLIYATWRVTDNLSSLLQSVGASEKVFQLIDLLPSDQFISKGEHSVYCRIVI